MKKSLIFGVVLILIAAQAFALEVIEQSPNLKVTHTGPTYVQVGGEAIFTVTVQNIGSRVQELSLAADPFSGLPNSKFEYILISNNRMSINTGQQAKTNVTIKLKKSTLPKENYGTFITLQSLTNSEKTDHGFILRVVPPEDIFELKTSVPEKVQPGREFTVGVSLKSNLNTNIRDVKVVVNSEFFNEERVINFFPYQEREESFTFTIPQLAKPSEYNLSIRVIQADFLTDNAKILFRVLEKTDVKEKLEVNSQFLKTTYLVTKSNAGNTWVEESFDLPLNMFQRSFASYSADPSSSDGAGWHWQFRIELDSEYKLSVTINYQPLFAGILLVVFVALLSGYLLSRGVTIRKEILKIKQTPDGMSELKVLLHIKNKSGKSVHNVAVIELLPNLIYPSTQFGTLHPEKVQKGEKGVKLTWTLNELLAGEERILSYTVHSKINMIGKFLLPPALVRYKNPRGKTINSKSNPLSFFSGSREIKAPE